MKSSRQFRLDPLRRGASPRLSNAEAVPPAGVPEGDDLSRETAKATDRIAALQRILYADARFALLIILQGRDASGKDGTVRHVFSVVNPQGCDVTSFSAPTDAERHHDYLWRVHAKVPARGMIGIFNRSHYEDVLAARVHRLAKPAEIAGRYDEINNFERMLVRNNVQILKFYLHISRAEQRRRLVDRQHDRTKNWKLAASDLDDRAHWAAYTSAYRDMLTRCNTPEAPWYVVPADDKHVRNWLIARVIADRLSSLHLRYPAPDPDIAALKIR